MSGGISQQFCVRWNSHLGSLGAAFPQLLAGQRFVDVTLACEGHQVHCHRLVLAACSSYFESLLGENPCKHPIIILPRDIKLWEIQALVDFMYKGEVNVSQAGLPDLLKCAEILQIRGLCGSDASLNLNQVASSNIPNQLPLSTPLNSHNNNILSNILTSTPKPTQNISLSPPTIKKPSQENLLSPNPTNKLPTQSSNLPGTPSTSTVPPQSQNITATSNTQKEQSQTSATPIMDGPAISLDDGEDSMNESNSEIIEESELKIQEDYSDDNSIVKLEPDNDTNAYEKQQNHTNFQPNSSPNFNKIRVKSNANLFENYKRQKIYHPLSNLNFNNDNELSQVNISTDNMEFSTIHNSLLNPCSSSSGIDNEVLPTSLKFNKNSMTIFVKKTSQEFNDLEINEICENIPKENSFEIMNETNYETIICSPNLSSLAHDQENEQNEIIKKYECGNNEFSNIFNYGNKSNRTESCTMMNDFVKNNCYISESIDLTCDDDIEIEENPIDIKPPITFMPELIKFETSRKRKKEILKAEIRKYEKETIENSLLNGGPPPKTFVLRNPRGNQPRTYNTDALWGALMDVKSGESIYRASQIHKVPRKTLRNWMKRWDIKSAYPMPTQLRQAAEKRKAKTTYCEENNEMLVNQTI